MEKGKNDELVLVISPSFLPAAVAVLNVYVVF